MKRLVLQKLVIISQKNEDAKIINFNEKLTIVTGDNPTGTTINRTGKSLVMKSIYYSLGAKLKKYTTNWKSLQIATIVNFSFDGKDYELYRNNECFILTQAKGTMFFKSVSDLRLFFIELFNFKIRLPNNKNTSSISYAYPGGMFMPFYIDQDRGWSGTWDSFSDIIGGDWKKEIFLYHIGIRTPQYYDLLDEKMKIDIEQKENKSQENTLKIIYKNHIEKYQQYLDINVNIEEFSKEIGELTQELNVQLNKKNAIKQEIVRCFNDIREAEELYIVAEKTYNELLKDADYVENNLSDDVIACPICGTVHQNSIQNHFEMYSEIQECEDVMHSYFEEKNKLESKVQKQTAKLNELEEYINNINKILTRKREAITFQEIIIAEGSKSILKDLKEELALLEEKILKCEKRLKEIRSEQTTISKAGGPIKDLYIQNLMHNLLQLNVIDIDNKELKDIKLSFNSGGNDLPCAIMAQVYALFTVANKYSISVCSPIVLDAIFQQEPAQEKIDKIWQFAIMDQPIDSQLILSTTELHGDVPEGTIIRLTKEKNALNTTDYEAEREKIIDYKDKLLKMLKEESN